MFGGLTFGGGPIGNYMSHAIAAMVGRLRSSGSVGATGLLFANGGYATHNHTVALSSRPIAAARFPQEFDYQGEAEAARGAVPELVKDYEGAAAIETYTVHHARDGAPRMGSIVVRTADDRRTLALVGGADAETIAFLTDGRSEPVGTRGKVVRQSDVQIWKPSDIA